MKGLLFLPPTPLLPHHTGISKCARRPRTAIVSSSAPQDANSEPDWLRQIANDLAPDSTEEPVRAAPQWTYPDGNPADIDSESNPWDAWTDVREADEERFVQRDPKAETDFWRSAAREVAPGPDIDTSGVKGKARERSDETVEGRERSEDAAGPTKSNAWALWNEALRNEAAQELKQRDPKAETDFWRSTARELSSSEPVNPAEELSETLEEANSEDVWRMARGVTGEVSDLQDRLRSELERYNPDENTDQYRDIARELVGPPDDPLDTEPKRVDAESGSGWNPDVDWKRFDDINREREADAQRGVREAAEREAWRARNEFLVGDVAGDAAGDAAGDMPGFMKNRFKGDGMYGASWSGAEDEMRALEEEGVPLRDARADAEAWRSIAKEINVEVGVDGEGIGDVEEVVEGVKDLDLGDEDAADGGSWSAWKKGNTAWETANEKIEDRDAQKEVDMWRSGAREIASGIPQGEEKKAESGGNGEGMWSEWREANDKWEQSVGSSDETPQQNVWKKDSSDWGRSLGGKTNSERSAWQQWNTVSWKKPRSGDQQWWETRSEGMDAVDRSNSNIDEWKAVWRDMSADEQTTGVGKIGEDVIPRDERIENDSSLDSWRSMARDMVDPDSLKKDGE